MNVVVLFPISGFAQVPTYVRHFKSSSSMRFMDKAQTWLLASLVERMLPLRHGDIATALHIAQLLLHVLLEAI